MTRTDVPRSGTLPLVNWLSNGGSGWVLGLIPLSLTLWFASMLPPIIAGEVLRVSYSWIPMP
ncbi:MAG: hypothetical protein HC828_20070, partial [Blastochloris sp.]|nr:hypothetical protein [Blastochloris sp.]